MFSILALIVLLFLVGILFMLAASLFFVCTVAIKAVSAGSAWVAKRQEQDRQLTVLAQSPETSLLRARNVPESPPEVLVRPVSEMPITDTEELLRVVEE